jgi:hypothetical protein
MENINQPIKNHMDSTITPKMKDMERAVKTLKRKSKRGLLYHLFDKIRFSRTLSTHLKSKIGYESIKIWKGKR